MKRLLYSVSTIGIGNEIKKKLEEELFKEFFCTEIKNELNGYNKNFNYKLIAGFFKRLKFNEKLEYYHKKIILKEIKKQKGIDYFLSIGNMRFNKIFFQQLKNNNPQIKTILFLWDKVEYLPNDAVENIENFDFIFTYDKDDSEKYGYIFRPTFYIEEDYTKWNDKKYDIYYIGALREKKRYEYLCKIKNYLEKNNLKYYMKAFVDKELREYLPKDYDKNIIIKKRITYKENLNFLKESRVVLDIGYKNQKGLSLRPYEALGMNIKLITDNEKVKNYEFYNEDNIKIIKNIEEIESLEKSFFENPYSKIDEELKNRYTIKIFLKEIFNIV